MFRSRQIAGRPHLAAAAILGVFVGFAAAEEATRLRSSVRAAPKIGEIRIDGVLDEPAWSAEGVIPGLVQQAPRPGEPTPYRTEVRILADPGAISITGPGAWGRRRGSGSSTPVTSRSSRRSRTGRARAAASPRSSRPRTTSATCPRATSSSASGRSRPWWRSLPTSRSRATVQYDSGSRNVGLNARLRWTVKPGNDVFLVWNRGWLSSAERNSFGLEKQSDQLVVKARWTLRP